MNTQVNPIPPGYEGAVPYLIVTGAADAIAFYKRAFDATEIMRLAAPDGQIMHAEIRIGQAVVMLADESPQWQTRSAGTLGDSPVSIALYVADVDTFVAQAVSAGATLAMPLEDHFYGDRRGLLVDPFGHKWSVASHIEDVAPEEIEKRAAAMFSGAS